MAFFHRGTARVFARSLRLQWGASIPHCGRLRDAENNPSWSRDSTALWCRGDWPSLQGAWFKCLQQTEQGRAWVLQDLFIHCVSNTREGTTQINICGWLMFFTECTELQNCCNKMGKEQTWGFSLPSPMVWTEVVPLDAAVLWQYILNENSIYYWKSSEETVSFRCRYILKEWV